MVQRHDFLVIRCDEEDGEYVAYTDYAALEQRFDALSSKFAAMVACKAKGEGDGR